MKRGIGTEQMNMQSDLVEWTFLWCICV